MYKPPVRPSLFIPMNSSIDQQADLLLLLCTMGLVGLFMVLTVYVGYYALLYRRQDNARRRRTTNHAKQEIRSEVCDIDRTECRCPCNRYQNNNSDWSTVLSSSSSWRSSGTDAESSTEVESFNNFELAAIKQNHEWPPVQQLRVHANNLTNATSWCSHNYSYNATSDRVV